MKKLKSVLLAAILVAAVVSLVACSGNNSGDNSGETEQAVVSTTEATTTEATTEEKSSETYESIYNEYTAKMKEAAPTLAKEYETEAAEITGDLTALAELSNSKVSKLAEICTEGTEKMASLKIKNGDAYDVYESWATKLSAVYEEQAALITDAYMNSVV